MKRASRPIRGPLLSGVLAAVGLAGCIEVAPYEPCTEGSCGAGRYCNAEGACVAGERADGGPSGDAVAADARTPDGAPDGEAPDGAPEGDTGADGAVADMRASDGPSAGDGAPAPNMETEDAARDGERPDGLVADVGPDAAEPPLDEGTDGPPPPDGGPDPDAAMPDGAEPDAAPVEAHDDDHDGIPSPLDNCPDTWNPTQLNGDLDGLGDACDDDDDGDGLLDELDPCPLLPDVSPWVCAPDADGDGVDDRVDRCPTIAKPHQAVYCAGDADEDGIVDAEDVCPGVPDPAQLDSDEDGVGDACDADDDGDGVPDFVDNCPLVASENHADADGDGLGAPCDEDEAEGAIRDWDARPAPGSCPDDWDPTSVFWAVLDDRLQGWSGGDVASVVGDFDALALAPDGRVGVVQQGDVLRAVLLSRGFLGEPVQLAAAPEAISISADGRVVATLQGGRLGAFDLVTGEVIDIGPGADLDRDVAGASLIVLDPDGETAWLNHPDGGLQRVPISAFGARQRPPGGVVSALVTSPFDADLLWTGVGSTLRTFSKSAQTFTGEPVDLTPDGVGGGTVTIVALSTGVTADEVFAVVRVEPMEGGAAAHVVRYDPTFEPAVRFEVALDVPEGGAPTEWSVAVDPGGRNVAVVTPGQAVQTFEREGGAGRATPGGAAVLVVAGGGANLERCNGRDDDCDGSVDEDLGVGQHCGAPGACGVGVIECAPGGSVRCSSAPGGSEWTWRIELCGGGDDDCDGEVDDVTDLPDLLTVDVGEGSDPVVAWRGTNDGGSRLGVSWTGAGGALFRRFDGALEPVGEPIDAHALDVRGETAVVWTSDGDEWTVLGAGFPCRSARIREANPEEARADSGIDGVDCLGGVAMAVDDNRRLHAVGIQTGSGWPYFVHFLGGDVFHEEVARVGPVSMVGVGSTFVAVYGDGGEEPAVYSLRAEWQMGHGETRLLSPAYTYDLARDRANNRLLLAWSGDDGLNLQILSEGGDILQGDPVTFGAAGDRGPRVAVTESEVLVLFERAERLWVMRFSSDLLTQKVPLPLPVAAESAHPRIIAAGDGYALVFAEGGQVKLWHGVLGCGFAE